MFKPKYQLPLYLALILLAPIGANAADSMPDLLKKVADLRDSAEGDIDYVNRTAPNCASAGESLQKVREALSDAKKTIAGYSKVMEEGYAGVLDGADGTCKVIDKSLSKTAEDASSKVSNSIENFLDKLNTVADDPRNMLFRYTYDQVMMKALAATTDGKFPKCVPSNPNDLNSNPESKRYLAFKDKLQEMDKIVVKLRKLVKDKLKNGCKSASIQSWQSASIEGDSESAL